MLIVFGNSLFSSLNNLSKTVCICILPKTLQNPRRRQEKGRPNYRHKCRNSESFLPGKVHKKYTNMAEWTVWGNVTSMLLVCQRWRRFAMTTLLTRFTTNIFILNATTSKA